MDDQKKDDIDPKGPPQRTAPKNYRTITCLPMMWAADCFPRNKKDATKDPEAEES